MNGRKLLQINVTANWGSTGRIAEDIGDFEITQGWKVGLLMENANLKAIQILFV